MFGQIYSKELEKWAPYESLHLAQRVSGDLGGNLSRVVKVCRHAGSLDPGESVHRSPGRAARSPAAPGSCSPVTFLAEGRWEPQEAAGG